MTINDAIQAYKAYQILKDKPMPIKTAYKFARLGRFLQPIIDFYLEKYTALLDQYCERDENGKPLYSEQDQTIQLKEGVLAEYQQAMTELESSETGEEPIQILQFEDFDGIGNFTPSELSFLLPFIIE